jgi:hypothetical protein
VVAEEAPKGAGVELPKGVANDNPPVPDDPNGVLLDGAGPNGEGDGTALLPNGETLFLCIFEDENGEGAGAAKPPPLSLLPPIGANGDKFDCAAGCVPNREEGFVVCPAVVPKGEKDVSVSDALRFDVNGDCNISEGSRVEDSVNGLGTLYFAPSLANISGSRP